MSHIGNTPIRIPEGLQVQMKGNTLTFTSVAKQVRAIILPDGLNCVIDLDHNVIRLSFKSKRLKAFSGLYRSLIYNIVFGLTQGFIRRLELVGIGFRAAMEGRSLRMRLGYSHDVIYTCPEGVEITCVTPTQILVSGIDLVVVSQAASDIRSLRRADPYKGKGIRYFGENIRYKIGKRK